MTTKIPGGAAFVPDISLSQSDFSEIEKAAGLTLDPSQKQRLAELVGQYQENAALQAIAPRPKVVADKLNRLAIAADAFAAALDDLANNDAARIQLVAASGGTMASSDIAPLTEKALRLHAFATKAKNRLPTDTGGNVVDWPRHAMIDGLHSIFVEASGGRRNKVTYSPTADGYGGGFFEMVSTVFIRLEGEAKPDAIAIEIRRALAGKDSTSVKRKR